MQVHLLGTGGYYANEVRQTPCAHFPEIGLIIDAGSALPRIMDTNTHSEVRLYLTHAHHDHINGIPFLLVPILQKKIKLVTIYGKKETLNAVHYHLLDTALFPVHIPMSWKLLKDEGAHQLTPDVVLRWQTLPSHPGGSIAFRIDSTTNGRKSSISYITDTRVDGTYDDFIAGSELLIHECNFKDDQQDIAKITGHSYASSVAELAVRTGVGKLVIIHLDATSPLLDPVGIETLQAIFPESYLGVDGMILEVP